MKFTFASDEEVASDHFDSDDEQIEQYLGEETNQNETGDTIDTNEASDRRKITIDVCPQHPS